jgi:maltose O-acetyltransferase
LGDAVLSIGEECGFNVGCVFDLSAPISIGNHVGVGHDVLFVTKTHAPGPGNRRAGREVCAPIIIEDGAWIGARCVILPGVTIGTGAVIAANMIIEQDVPAQQLQLGAQKLSLARWRA